MTTTSNCFLAGGGGEGSTVWEGGGSLGEMLLVTTVLSKSGWGLGAGGGGGCPAAPYIQPLTRSLPQLSPALCLLSLLLSGKSVELGAFLWEKGPQVSKGAP